MKERPWKNLLKVTDPVDRYCSSLQLGSTLAMGNPPLFRKLDVCLAILLRTLPPSLFQIAKFKKRSVALSYTMTIGSGTFSKSPPLPSLKSSLFFSWLY
jgi:hypothetical protein